MKKTKIITILIALGIVTAMTGIAAAAPENIRVLPEDQSLEPSQTPPGGTYSTYTVSVTEIVEMIGGNSHTIKATTTLIVSGTGNLNDLRFRFHHSGDPSSIWLTSGSTYSWTDSGGDTDSLTLDVMDTGSAVNTKYQFKVYDSYPIGTGSDSGEGTVYGTSIPEFATIAIPAVAILGLFLFFNRRKQKKE